MLRRKEMNSATEKTAQNQCRLCLRYVSEFCSFANRLEDTRTVQEVIKMMLSIEDDPSLPQQICSSCSKELLHMTQLKDCWVANQFTLARQAILTRPDKEKESDMVKFQEDDQSGVEMYLEVDVNVSDSELFPVKTELKEYSAEESLDAHVKYTDRASKEPIEKKNKSYNYVKKCGEYKFRCIKCYLSFPTLNLKKEHIKLHNKCEICGATFMMKNDLRRHMRKHNGERPHNCSHCYQSFSRMNHLKEHLKRHEYVQTFACLLCTKNFTNKQNLFQHKKEAHSNKRRTQRQKATKVERLPFQGTIRKSGGETQQPVVVKEECVDEDYELIID